MEKRVLGVMSPNLKVPISLTNGTYLVESAQESLVPEIDASIIPAFCARNGVEADLLGQLSTGTYGDTVLSVLTGCGVRVLGERVKDNNQFIGYLSQGCRGHIRRCRDNGNSTWESFPEVNIENYSAIVADGSYARHSRKILGDAWARGLATVFVGNIDDIKAFLDCDMPFSIDLAVCPAECGQQPEVVLKALRQRCCISGIVTAGTQGVYWYETPGDVEHHIPALRVPQKEILNTYNRVDFFAAGVAYSIISRGCCADFTEHVRFGLRAEANSLRSLDAVSCLTSTIEDIVEFAQQLE